MKNNKKMSPTRFLKSSLTALASKFNNISIKYAFNEDLGLHVVELAPVWKYHTDEALTAHWIGLSIQFGFRFDEDIAFVSSDSNLRVTKPEMEWHSDKRNTTLELLQTIQNTTVPG